MTETVTQGILLQYYDIKDVEITSISIMWEMGKEHVGSSYFQYSAIKPLK